jgi:hypothetical protein
VGTPGTYQSPPEALGLAVTVTVGFVPVPPDPISTPQKVAYHSWIAESVPSLVSAPVQGGSQMPVVPCMNGVSLESLQKHCFCSASVAPGLAGGTHFPFTSKSVPHSLAHSGRLANGMMVICGVAGRCQHVRYGEPPVTWIGTGSNGANSVIVLIFDWKIEVLC